MAPELLLAALLPALAGAAVWPEQLGPYRRVSAAPIQVSERPLWQEYGLEQAESAEYQSEGRKFRAEAWRLQDSTGAFAAFQWQRPAGARDWDRGELSAGDGTGGWIAAGNYLLHFEGYKPAAEELRTLLQSLPSLRRAALPSLSAYLPRKNLVPGSERYLLGPAGLERFLPGVPAGSAGFEFSAEAQTAQYRLPSGVIRLSLFAYPTPEIARVKLADLAKIEGAVVKRSGPLVVLISPPVHAADAQQLLGQIEYQSKITWSERVPTRRDNIGELLLNIFILCGILILVCIGGGLAVGGVRALSRRRGDPMILLHLADR
ncbi:MAG: hypothetical protein IT158_28860 [Bryobacterales bacterium]|nr:hypothetical protein [Bryobacterales bacterium]